MIWEQDVRVIVMLTAETEGGQLKCHPYWKERDYGSIRLKPLSEKKASLDLDRHHSHSGTSASSSADGHSGTGRKRATTVTMPNSATPTAESLQSQNEAPYVIIRKFALTHSAHPFEPLREITHLHFPSWPDFGTPTKPSHLLALVELANVMQRAALPSATSSGRRASDLTSTPWLDEPETDAEARPMLVHCSAGCGRTGTFCAVDSVIDMLKRQRLETSQHSKTKDAEGDVAMGDSASDMKPSATLTQASLRLPLMFQREAAPSPRTIDTTWLGDDSLDLIQRTVEDFRQQRLSMVQTLRQFVLCYETILEWIKRTADGTNKATNPGRARGTSFSEPRQG